MYEAQLEFPEGGVGGGSLRKISSIGEVMIFSGITHSICSCRRPNRDDGHMGDVGKHRILNCSLQQSWL